MRSPAGHFGFPKGQSEQRKKAAKKEAGRQKGSNHRDGKLRCKCGGKRAGPNSASGWGGGCSSSKRSTWAICPCECRLETTRPYSCKKAKKTAL